MLFELFIIILLCGLYFLFYVELKINKNNEISEFSDELTRQNLNNEIMFKAPFYFDASHLNNGVREEDKILIEKDKKNRSKKFSTLSVPPKIFFPFIKHSSHNTLYDIKKDGKIPLQPNRYSFCYYFVKKGNAKFSLVHPKFKDNFEDYPRWSDDKYIWENLSFKQIECSEGTVVYVPNKWMVSVKSDGEQDSVVEEMGFKSPINYLLSFVKKEFNYNTKIV